MTLDSWEGEKPPTRSDRRDHGGSTPDPSLFIHHAAPGAEPKRELFAANNVAFEPNVVVCPLVALATLADLHRHISRLRRSAAASRRMALIVVFGFPAFRRRRPSR